MLFQLQKEKQKASEYESEDFLFLLELIDLLFHHFLSINNLTITNQCIVIQTFT